MSLCSCDIPVCLTYDGSSSHCIDLGHTLDAETIFWPGGEGFSLCMTCIKIDSGKIQTTITTTNSNSDPTSVYSETNTNNSDVESFYSAGVIKCSEHGGTHVDTPFHFCSTGKTVNLIPLRDLMGCARVIDVMKSVESNRDYILSPDDILSYERLIGKELSKGDIVLIKTGWAVKYRMGALEYLGYDGSPYETTVTNLSFPGIGEAAARLFVARGVTAVGIDTASLDAGASKDFVSHKILLGNGIYGIENINADIDKIPPTGSFIMVMPMKIKDGSGAPARVIAFY